MASQASSIRAVFLGVALGAIGCTNPAADRLLPRTFRLGFSATPPRLEVASVLQTIDQWTKHGDAALLALTPPWRSLLADTSAALLVRRDQADLVALYRSKGLPIVVMVDATDGLAREKEAPELVALGRSIREPAVQAAFREYVIAVDSILHPDYLAPAMETNLIRAIAPADLYAAVRMMANGAAQALRDHGSTTKLYVSVQVETAWGRLPTTGQYVGVTADVRDFPFAQLLGLSSYPFLAGFSEPEEIPLDYYQRLAAEAGLPVMVVEGGWSSGSVSGVTSSPLKQARYVDRQIQLADRAHALAILQITFTDLDLSTYPVPPGSILPLFAQLGLVDASFRPKLALAGWDRALARPLAR
jgi:hypothetical protein